MLKNKESKLLFFEEKITSIHPNWMKTALMGNSTDQTSSILDLKFSHRCELYRVDLKIYNQLEHLKKTLMNSAFKSYKCYTCSGMKEKPLELNLGGLNLISSDSSSIRTAGSEYRLKKTDFKILVKPLGFVVKHYINII